MTNVWEDVRLKGCHPLRHMLPVLPAGALSLVVLPRNGFERVGLRHRFSGFLGVPSVNRVYFAV